MTVAKILVSIGTLALSGVFGVILGWIEKKAREEDADVQMYDRCPLANYPTICRHYEPKEDETNAETRES